VWQLRKNGLDSFEKWIRVARWFVFEPKHPNLGKFWRALELNM
jgi:hypothetical protein